MNEKGPENLDSGKEGGGEPTPVLETREELEMLESLKRQEVDAYIAKKDNVGYKKSLAEIREIQKKIAQLPRKETPKPAPVESMVEENEEKKLAQLKERYKGTYNFEKLESFDYDSLIAFRRFLLGQIKDFKEEGPLNTLKEYLSRTEKLIPEVGVKENKRLTEKALSDLMSRFLSVGIPIDMVTEKLSNFEKLTFEQLRVVQVLLEKCLGKFPENRYVKERLDFVNRLLSNIQKDKKIENVESKIEKTSWTTKNEIELMALREEAKRRGLIK